MIQAGSMGVPFVSTLGYAGTDILERRPADFRIINDPFEADERIVVARAINPDVAIFHGPKGDKYGNVLVKQRGEELMLAQASRRVIVSVEEIVDEVGIDDPDGWFIPAIHVSAVVHAPYGAHPTSAPGFYDADESLIEEYVDAARSQDSFDAYLEQQVHEVESHEGYLRRMGLAAPEAVSS
ncbi:MAG: CoA-transferase [SAR202 cluster bacterium]|nr:CoA-transferase [SAR202 cluster bacterium]